MRYFTVIIPALAPEQANLQTEWHPTETTGPFATISRGNFPTEEKAHAWAREKLGEAPYSVKDYTLWTIDGDDLAKLKTVASRLFTENRLNGDEMRDLAQAIDIVVRRAERLSVP